jgi:HK97 family phage portal protein
VGILSKVKNRIGVVDPARLVPVEAKVNGNGHGDVEMKRSGVTFVGPSVRNDKLIWLDPSSPKPNAAELTRSIALATSAYAYTAIFYRATKLAEPPLMVTDETEDGYEWDPDHELSTVLEIPSPDFDMGELQIITEAYRLISGSALWVKNNDLIDRVGQLTPYSGDEFETKAKDGRIYGEFIVSTKKGKKTFTPDEVIFLRDLNPYSWRHGLSRLDVALSMLDLGHQVNRTIRNFMRKAMFPGGIISPHHEWNPDEDEFDQFKEMIEQWHGGPENAGQPLVLIGGATFSRSAFPLKELLPTEILDRIEATIASVFGIPPVVLGWLVGLKNSPWSQMSEARRMTYEDTIEPRWRDIEKRLSRQMLDRREFEEGKRIRFDTSGVRALQIDTAQRAVTATAMREEWTRDERRIYTGQEPIGGEAGEQIGTTNVSPVSISMSTGVSGPGSTEPVEDTDTGDNDDAPLPGSDAESGVEAENTLNGAQITAALEVLTRLNGATNEEGETVPGLSALAAIELLVAVGIRRERAEAIVEAEVEKEGKKLLPFPVAQKGQE